MSTRSVICGMTAEGPKVNFIRFDGYPEFPGVGSKLVAFYSEPEAARTLLALGDMVTLGKSLEECEIPDEFKTSRAAYPVDDRPDEGMRETLMRVMAQDDGWPIEWGYVFENGRWDCIASPHYVGEWNGVPAAEAAREGLAHKTWTQYAVIAGMTDEGPELIWIHSGGIPEPPGVGQTLLDNYRDPEAVKELLAGGDLHGLRATPEENAELSRRAEGYPTVLEIKEAPSGRIADTVLETVKSEWTGAGVAWAYLFEDGGWQCCQAPWFAREWEGAALEKVVEAQTAARQAAEAEETPTP